MTMYQLSKEEAARLQHIVELVRRDPERFSAAASALDAEYNNQALRDQKAKQRVEDRKTPGRKRRTRALERRYFTDNPDEVVNLPRKRVRDQLGVLTKPELSLRERFAIAFRETFRKGLALHVPNSDRRREIVDRRILMAWLRWDPDRATIRRITAFQGLRTVATEDGIGSLWSEGTLLEPSTGDVLRVRLDGRLKHAETAWIELAIDALESFLADPQGGIVPSFVARLRSALDRLANLTDEPPAAGNRHQKKKLANLTTECIRSLGACYESSVQLQVALRSVWTGKIAVEVAEMRESIDTIRAMLRGHRALEISHPVLPASSAPNEEKRLWIKHEKRLRRMLHRLPCLNVGGTDGQALSATPAKRDQRAKSTSAGKKKRRVQRRTPTDKQLEAIKVVGESKNNFAEAGRRLGKDPKTVRQLYLAALRKAEGLVPTLRKPKIKPLPIDHRGQIDIGGSKKGARVATAEAVSQPAKRRTSQA